MPHRFRHISLGDTLSTNEEAFQLAKDGDPGNLWITAQRQLKGKGSRGRNWDSPTGNLYASLLLIEPSAPEKFGELAFVSALAVFHALSTIDGDADVTLKWPNDVLLNGGKCCGILLENHEINKTRAIIIGVGLNCQNAPTGTPYPATSLKQEGLQHDPSFVFQHLKTGFAHFLDVWNKGYNFESIRSIWLSHAHNLGKPVTVSFANGNKEQGSFKTIDDKGLLMLEKADGSIKKISVADLFFDQPETG